LNLCYLVGMKNSSAVTIYNSNLRKTVALFALHESVKYYAKYGTNVFGAFLDSSKAFDKVLHNALLIKLLDKNVPISFVLLLINELRF